MEHTPKSKYERNSFMNRLLRVWGNSGACARDVIHNQIIHTKNIYIVKTHAKCQAQVDNNFTATQKTTIICHKSIVQVISYYPYFINTHDLNVDGASYKSSRQMRNLALTSDQRTLRKVNLKNLQDVLNLTEKSSHM